MRIDGAQNIDAKPRVFAPYMVVNPGENWVAAARRHRRETGHKGGVIIVADNNERSAAA